MDALRRKSRPAYCKKTSYRLIHHTLDKYRILCSVTFGQRVAEDETSLLSSYFVETDDWERLYRGEIDIVYGPKGSGKSALYALLLSRGTELFDRNILLVAAENPRGAPAFRDLVADPPTDERQFVGLWKLYFAAVLHSVLFDYGIKNRAATELGDSLAHEGLIKGQRTLGALLTRTLNYVRNALRPQAIEGGVELDPLTQLPSGFNGKIVFSEPKADNEAKYRSVDNLLLSRRRCLGGGGCQKLDSIGPSR